MLFMKFEEQICKNSTNRRVNFVFSRTMNILYILAKVKINLNWTISYLNFYSLTTTAPKELTLLTKSIKV